MHCTQRRLLHVHTSYILLHAARQQLLYTFRPDAESYIQQDFKGGGARQVQCSI